jgi:glycosyltransferase involved in cell wall biosynthesis
MKTYSGNSTVTTPYPNKIKAELCVLMGVFNAETTLLRAVDSVRQQSYSNFRFIIVDDGSTDSTPKLLQQIAQQDVRIEVLTLTQNVGLTRALIHGLSVVSEVFLARMDADDWSEPDRFKTQLEAMKQNPQWLACGSDFWVEDPSQGTKKIITRPKKDVRKALRTKNYFAHGSLIFRTNSLKTIGGYDEFFRLAQDYDLLLRLSKIGDLGWVENCLYELRISGGSLSATQMSKQIHYAALAKARFILGPKDAATITQTLHGKLVYGWERFRIWLFVYKGGLSLKKLTSLK